MPYWLEQLLAVLLGLLLSALPTDLRRVATALQDGPNAVQAEEEKRAGGSSPARSEQGGGGLCVGVALRPSGPEVRIRTLNDGTRVSIARSGGPVVLCRAEARAPARPPAERPGRRPRGESCRD